MAAHPTPARQLPPLPTPAALVNAHRLIKRTGAGTIAFVSRLGEQRAGLIASAALHVLLLFVALLVFPTPSLRAPPPEAISVELITEVPAVSRDPSEPPRPADIPRPPADFAALPQLPLAHARIIFSTDALDSVARASLRTLAGDARFEQLCNIEAMEQIAHSSELHNPERVIAYLAAGTRMDGDTLVADGAAFLSKGHWYELAYRCLASPDRRKVVSFDFATGEQIPDDHPALPSGDSD